MKNSKSHTATRRIFSGSLLTKTLVNLLLIGAAGSYNAQTNWSTTLNSGSGLKLGTSSSHNLTIYTNNQEKMSLSTDGTLKLNSMASSEDRLLYVDSHGNLKAISSGGTSPGVANRPCIPSALPWYNGGNYSPANNRIGTCSADDFILKANNQEAIFLTTNAYVGIGLNNSSPASVLDIIDGTISGNTNHLKIFGNVAGDIQSTGNMNLASGNDAGFSSANNMNVASGNNMLHTSTNDMGLTCGGTMNGSAVYDMNLSTVNGNVNLLAAYDVYASSAMSTNMVFDASSFGASFNIHAGAYSPGTSEKVTVRSNGRVGIGTTNPLCKLWVQDATAAEARVHTVNGVAKTTVSNGIGGYSFSIDNTVDGIGHISAGNNIINFKNTGSGPSAYPQVWIGKRPTIAPHDDFQLAVNGKIVAKSIYVTLTGAWADYVFEPDYCLPKLSEVETFYKKNKHLPDVPGAHEVGEKGVDVAEMNTVLLRKVEELTIYMVELQKEVDALKQNAAKK